MNYKKVMVTGGAGFIGMNLCRKLIEEGHEVSVVDNYYSGSRDNHVDGVEYHCLSTAELGTWTGPIPDIVYHLGEYSRVESSFEDIQVVLDSNVIGTKAVIEFCRRHDCKLVYAGSSTKFGDGGLGRDQSPYSWTKASNTELVINYGDWFGLNYAITYFYNVYGPGERGMNGHGTLIEIYRECYEKGEALPVVMPGTQKRNFTHVFDIVDGLYLVGEKGEGDNYGLGCEKSFSVLEIAQMFDAPITYLDERPGNRMSSHLDVSRAAREFGWKASNSIERYINELKANVA